MGRGLSASTAWRKWREKWVQVSTSIRSSLSATRGRRSVMCSAKSSALAGRVGLKRREDDLVVFDPDVAVLAGESLLDLGHGTVDLDFAGFQAH